MASRCTCHFEPDFIHPAGEDYVEDCEGKVVAHCPSAAVAELVAHALNLAVNRTTLTACLVPGHREERSWSHDWNVPPPGPWCDARGANGYCCTRAPGHDGDHVAGNGDGTVRDRWHQLPPSST